jgi:hypothetical protein
MNYAVMENYRTRAILTFHGIAYFISSNAIRPKEGE